MDTGQIITLVVALIVSVGTIIGARLSASGATTEAAIKLVKPLTQRIDGLERELKRCNIEVVKWKHGTTVLIAQLKRLGHIPDWTPDKDITLQLPRD